MYRVKVHTVTGTVSSVPLDTLETARTVLQDWVGRVGSLGGCIEFRLASGWVTMEEV